jgi:hypothetical protein
MNGEWQSGSPEAPGLYLVVEPYADNADVALRVWDGGRWQGIGRPRPSLWTPFPYPPGYAPRAGDPQMVETQP